MGHFNAIYFATISLGVIGLFSRRRISKILSGIVFGMLSSTIFVSITF